MSFFKKTLASLGIGSANVDSIIHDEVLIPGETVAITVQVTGGSTEQAIDNIELSLCCRYMAEVERENEEGESETETEVRTHVLAEWSLPYAFTINAGESRDFEVELELPLNTPVTVGDSKVWLETGLDIDFALDPSDKDMLTVRPDPIMEGIFNTLEDAGLRVRQVECEAVDGFALPFVQEFEFVPVTGPYHGVWRELEIVAYRDDEQLQLWFEIDRQQRGVRGLLANLLGTGELERHLVIDATVSPEEAGQQVIDFLEQTT